MFQRGAGLRGACVLIAGSILLTLLFALTPPAASPPDVSALLKQADSFSIVVNSGALLVCEDVQHAAEQHSSATCTSGHAFHSTVHKNVTYHVSADDANLTTPTALYSLLGKMLRHKGTNFSISVHFETSVSCQLSSDGLPGKVYHRSSRKQLTLIVGSCSWWKLVLSATGYHVHLGDPITMIAVPLSKRNCGRACEALDLVRFPQAGVDFLAEYNLPNLSSGEKTRISSLHVKDLSQDMHDSCAVVFSSGIINAIDPALGELIDSHDAVFRFNHAPPGGIHKQYAGGKSTYRVVFVPEYGAKPFISPPEVEAIDDALLLLSVHYKKRAKRIVEYDLQSGSKVAIIPTKDLWVCSYPFIFAKKLLSLAPLWEVWRTSLEIYRTTTIGMTRPKTIFIAGS